MKISLTLRIKILRYFFIIVGVSLFLWWPLSHWFFSDWYHTLLGFELGSYQESMVKMIGTCGFFPVLLAILSSKDPIGNKSAVVTLIISSILLGLTFLHLILTKSFPEKEYFNVVLSFSVAGFLIIMFPWRIHE